MTTLNYVSPHRCQKSPSYSDNHDSAPIEEDDLFALGLSIWELWIGVVPFDDIYIDDIWEMVKEGKTVDVNAVGDGEVREIICGYLRLGGANIEDTESIDEWCRKKYAEIDARKALSEQKHVDMG
jgi:hypothetical protein